MDERGSTLRAALPALAHQQGFTWACSDWMGPAQPVNQLMPFWVILEVRLIPQASDHGVAADSR
jgi:hypothetical protein